MIDLYLDGALSWTSGQAGDELLALSCTTGRSISGCATITMPPAHRLRDSFISYRTVVELRRDNELVFRGRALYPTDDFLNRRTITCEGERGFFADGITPPHVYTGTPAEVFASVLAEYNSQVDAFKRFEVGEVDIVDSTNYLRLEAENPETTADTLGKLLDREGGVLVFDSSDTGRRVSWLTAPFTVCEQSIELGSNLLDLQASGCTEGLATRVYAYGARDDDGNRLTLASVNNGLTYLQNDEAVALRGVISAAVVYDDTTSAANLLAKAQAYLASSALMANSLTVNAVDLAAAGYAVGHFHAFDRVQVVSSAHGISATFEVDTLTEDLLQPANSVLTLGRSTASLSGADVAERLHREQAEQQLRQDIKQSTAAELYSAKVTYSSQLTQTEADILAAVKRDYVTTAGLQQEVATQVGITSSGLRVDLTNLQKTVDGNAEDAAALWREQGQYIDYSSSGLLLGDKTSSLQVRITNDELAFLDNGSTAAYINHGRMYITEGEFTTSLILGKFAFIPRNNGNLSFTRIKGGS